MVSSNCLQVGIGYSSPSTVTFLQFSAFSFSLTVMSKYSYSRRGISGVPGKRYPLEDVQLAAAESLKTGGKEKVFLEG